MSDLLGGNCTIWGDQYTVTTEKNDNPEWKVHRQGSELHLSWKPQQWLSTGGCFVTDRVKSAHGHFPHDNRPSENDPRAVVTTGEFWNSRGTKEVDTGVACCIKGVGRSHMKGVHTGYNPGISGEVWLGIDSFATHELASHASNAAEYFHAKELRQNLQQNQQNVCNPWCQLQIQRSISPQDTETWWLFIGLVDNLHTRSIWKFPGKRTAHTRECQGMNKFTHVDMSRMFDIVLHGETWNVSRNQSSGTCHFAEPFHKWSRKGAFPNMAEHMSQCCGTNKAAKFGLCHSTLPEGRSTSLQVTFCSCRVHALSCRFLFPKFWCKGARVPVICLCHWWTVSFFKCAKRSAGLWTAWPLKGICAWPQKIKENVHERKQSAQLRAPCSKFSFALFAGTDIFFEVRCKNNWGKGATVKPCKKCEDNRHGRLKGLPNKHTCRSTAQRAQVYFWITHSQQKSRNENFVAANDFFCA